MKRFELILGVLQVPIDFILLYVAAWAAYSLRFGEFVTQYREVTFDLPFYTYMSSALPFILLFVLVYGLSGLYSIKTSGRMLEEIKRVIFASALGFSFITVAVFLARNLFASRFIVLLAVVFAIVLVCIGRLLMRWVRFTFYQQGIGVNRVVLFGDDKTSQDIIAFLESNPYYGLKIVKKFKKITDQTIQQLESKFALLSPDMILLATPNASQKESEALFEFARQNHLPFSYIGEVYDSSIANRDMATLGGIPLVTIKRTPLDGWGRILKRLFDIVVGSLLFLIFLPIMLMIGLLVRIDSKGPAIYKNERVGKKGKSFFIYKFRRMKIEYCTGTGYDQAGKAEKYESTLIKEKSERKGPLYKVLDDPRNTRMGKFLEKTSLDDLPSFWNVVIGNMSLVGPRPHQPREVEKYETDHKTLFAIKPGITGLAQISGRSDLDFDEEYRLDSFYIQNWSLWMDFAILVKTPLSLLKRRKSA